VAKESTNTTGWFDIGWRVYEEGLRDADSFPRLNDMEARRVWLGGEECRGHSARLIEGFCDTGAEDPMSRQNL